MVGVAVGIGVGDTVTAGVKAGVAAGDGEGPGLGGRISAMASRSETSRPGLLTVSQKTALVLSLIAAAKLFGSVGSTKRGVIPNCGRMSLNCVNEPP